MSKYKCDYCGKETDDIHYIDLYNGEKLECHRCADCDDLVRRQIDWEADKNIVMKATLSVLIVIMSMMTTILVLTLMMAIAM